MVTEIFDYEVVKPDQSEILIKKGYITVGSLIWNNKEFDYEFLGKERVCQKELVEILGAITKLNKRSVLPKWLRWGSGRI